MKKIDWSNVIAGIIFTIIGAVIGFLAYPYISVII